MGTGKIHASAMAIKNTKGLVTTMAAVIIIVVIFSIVAIKIEQSREQGQSLAYKVRCDELSSFLDDITRDLQRATSITAKRAAVYSTGLVTHNGTVFASADTALNEMILNASLNNTKVSDLKNETLENWTEKISTLAVQRGFATNLNISLFVVNTTPVSHSEFWARIRIQGLSINDSFGYCDFAGNIPRETNWINGNVSISGFEDLLYVYMAKGYVSRTIVFDATPVALHDDSNVLTQDLLNKKYHAVYDAPSFFERLEGRLATGNDTARHNYYLGKAAQALNDNGVLVTTENVTIGMETFVDVNELQTYVPTEVQAAMIKTNQSVIDHIFFGPANKGKKVENISVSYPWFRMDDAHATTYGISQSHLYE
ncbi:TPA: hypothetical protein H1012_00875 [archaeon]|nr:hypothetical protein [Candidatus Naiadarchaeales archaeon SRR2090159.bin1288]